ncbi:MAG: nickel-dependent lactate racemase [Candidatus Omnitrophota bacterium]
MGHIRIPFEESDIDLDLPQAWRVIEEIKPKESQPLEDIPGSLIHGLEHPIGCPPINSLDLSRKKIVIAIDDVTRPTPTHLFFGCLLEHLFSCGARREDILLMAAVGSHRPMTAEELKKKVGAENISGIRWVNNDSADMGCHVSLGTTKMGTEVYLNKHLKEADIIFCLGRIEPHPLLGFGGGLKMILPGLAHVKTIAQNHMQGVSSEKFNYIGCAESPMRRDLEEAAGMLGNRIFIINVILDREFKITHFICGDPVKAHIEGAKISESINAYTVKQTADAAIVGSSPMNADLRQGLKCIANIEESVKEGGLIMAFLECRNGIGDLTTPKSMFPIDNRIFRLVLRILGKGRIFWLVDKLKRDGASAVDEKFLSHFSMQVARKNAIFICSKNLPPGIDRKVGLFRQFSDPQAMLREAERYLGKEANIYVSPYGGATYPKSH